MPPAIPSVDRLTTVISEPLSTGDALEKYQLLAQRVTTIIILNYGLFYNNSIFVH